MNWKMLAVVAAVGVGVYAYSKRVNSPWWSNLQLSPQQRSMLEEQERGFW